MRMTRVTQHVDLLLFGDAIKPEVLRVVPKQPKVEFFLRNVKFSCTMKEVVKYPSLLNNNGGVTKLMI